MVDLVRTIRDYPILLATDFSWEYYLDPKIQERKDPFYKNLGESVFSNTGKRVFNPLEDWRLLNETISQEVYSEMTLASRRLFEIISQFDLLLYDLGALSTGKGMILEKCFQKKIPVMVFHDTRDAYKRTSNWESAFVEGGLEINNAKIVTFSEDKEGLEKVVNSVKRFYE